MKKAYPLGFLFGLFLSSFIYIVPVPGASSLVGFAQKIASGFFSGTTASSLGVSFTFVIVYSLLILLLGSIIWFLVRKIKKIERGGFLLAVYGMATGIFIVALFLLYILTQIPGPSF